MNALGERRSLIKTLSMTGGGSDLLSSRLRVEQLLGALDLHPASLAPSAILCLRHLRDPRPGLLHLDGPALRPSPRWEEALRDALEAAARRAARPARETVGASADAVLFSDRSELLACLAHDALRGAVGARWWWRSLLPSGAGERAAFEAWLAAPEHVPGALQILGERGEAAAFVRALAPAELRALARAVGERFGARALLAVANMRPDETGEHTEPRGRVQVESSVNAALPWPPRRAAEPWRPWTPELLAERLDDLPRAFLGVALALHRAPAAARSLSFAGAMQRWIDGDTRDERAPEAPPPPSTGALSPTATNDADAPTAEGHRYSAPVLEGAFTLPAAPIPAAAPTHERPPDLAPSSAPSPAPRAAPSAHHDEPPPAIAAVDAPTPPLSSPFEKPTPIEASAPTAVPSPTVDEAPRVLPPPSWIEQPASLSPRSRAWGAPQRTAFGGVFFLINVGQHLELYGDFSTPLTPGIDLPLWDFLALVGRDLVGPALEDDAVWPLLAALSGRDPGAPPGQGFSPAPSWQIPPRWLLPFAADPVALARFSAEAPPPAPGSAPLDRWLGLVLPYVRARLARALGVVEEEAGRLTCALPARIQLTATHLDLTLSLADLPIELRLAGLDRDPGWVPAAGRYIAFHFG